MHPSGKRNFSVQVPEPDYQEFAMQDGRIVRELEGTRAAHMGQVQGAAGYDKRSDRVGCVSGSTAATQPAVCTDSLFVNNNLWQPEVTL